MVDKDKLYSFYKTFEEHQTEMYWYQLFIIDTINQHRPEYENVLDFGCNTGKMLSVIKTLKPEIDSWGIDFSISAVNKAKEKGLRVVLGNEHDLKRLNPSSVDVIYTSSVLSHIPDIDQILYHFIRIARKRIIFAETNDKQGEFYFLHDYQKFGFKKIVTMPNKFNIKYDIWQLDLE